MKYAVSACLMGVNCKYDGGNNRSEELVRFMADQEVILLCPESAGGLSIPRSSCEIVGDRVINRQGEDVTAFFEAGAEKEVQRLRKEQAELVILQPRSPSCGVGMVYDGSFSKRLVEGDGIFVKRCRQAGIRCINLPDFLAEIPK